MRLEEFFPDHRPESKKRRRKTPKKDLEGSVQHDCLEWLTDCPDVLYVERRNTGAVAFDDGGYVKFGKKGAADTWCLIKTIAGAEGFHDGEEVLEHVEIEFKRRDGKGRLSPDQLVFQKKMLDIQIPYVVATSAEDMAKQLQELGLTNWTKPGRIE